MQEATTPSTEARYNVKVWRDHKPFEQNFRGARAWTVAGSFLMLEDEEHKTFIFPASDIQGAQIDSFLIDTGDSLESEVNDAAE